MVRAILEGRKTQTRRLFDPLKFKRGVGYHGGWRPFNPEDKSERESLPIWCPYGEAGDRLWVREAWTHHADAKGLACIAYRADGAAFGAVYEHYGEGDFSHVDLSDPAKPYVTDFPIRWRPSIHMPRKASRITLEVTGVRVERLWDISEDDALAEGAALHVGPTGNDNAYERFRSLWESINGAGSWDANPWVWVVEFKRLEAKSGAA